MFTEVDTLKIQSCAWSGKDNLLRVSNFVVHTL